MTLQSIGKEGGFDIGTIEDLKTFDEAFSCQQSSNWLNVMKVCQSPCRKSWHMRTS